MFKQRSITYLILFACFSCSNQSTVDEQGEPINFSKVEVDGGMIAGLESQDQEIYTFKGIPYAAAPVGDLRWKTPQPVQPWEGVKGCDTFAASAVQASPTPFYMWSEEFLIPKTPIDEDCLYLNIWTGAKQAKEKRPVVVWIHGGGFMAGGGSVPIYDGEAMARKGVILVTINYRLGVFGFFAHPELTSESPHNASGNYGLLDQIAALQWVKRNIAAFGGDPENITIAGQSAGSVSVVYLVASPLAKGLFQKAIAQSGASLLSTTPGPNRQIISSLSEAEQAGIALAKTLQANSISELRNIPAIDLFKQANFDLRLITDGHVIPEEISKIYRENRQNPVRFLTGWNEDEGIVMGPIGNANAFKEGIYNQWGTLSEELLDFYPAPNDATAAISQKNLSRDLMFGVQNYTLANTVSQQGKDVYVYQFSRKVPPGEYKDFGAFHTAEVPYAFNNLKFVNRPWAAIDHELADVMSSYWVNFIKTGNPNGEGMLDWPSYNPKSHKIMRFDEGYQKEVLKDTLSLNFLSKNLMVD